MDCEREPQHQQMLGYVSRRSTLLIWLHKRRFSHVTNAGILVCTCAGAHALLRSLAPASVPVVGGNTDNDDPDCRVAGSSDNQHFCRLL